MLDVPPTTTHCSLLSPSVITTHDVVLVPLKSAQRWLSPNPHGAATARARPRDGLRAVKYNSHSS